MTYIKKRFWLRSAKPKSGKFHRRPMEKINRSEELLVYNFLMFCIRPRRGVPRVPYVFAIQKHGAVFSAIHSARLFQMPGFDDVQNPRSHASFLYGCE